MFVYTGYLDESGTHDDSAVTVMGGLLARDEQWRAFEKRFEEVRRKHNFRVFHTKKFKRRTGDFKGWSEQQVWALMHDLGYLIGSGLTDGVAVALHNDTYKEFYRAENIPTKARLDSKYGLCFRTCLLHFVLEVGKRKYRSKFPKLHIVLESGHRNVGDAERIFLETKRDLEAMNVDILASIRTALKDECGQLMMADFIAHTTFSIKSQNKPEPPALPEFSSLTAADRRQLKRQTSIQHFESTPAGLVNLRNHAITEFQRGKKK